MTESPNVFFILRVSQMSLCNINGSYTVPTENTQQYSFAQLLAAVCSLF